MARRTLGTAVVIALALTGCDSGAAPERAASERKAGVPLTVGNPYHDRLFALGELQRGAALRSAIRTARESCDRVEAAAFQQDHENLKMWTASCQSRTYAVFVAPNGDVQVRKCTDLASLKLPPCRAEPQA